MNYINQCPFCKSTGRRILLRQSHPDKYLSLVSEKAGVSKRVFYKCNKCKFIYINPRITKIEVKKIYDSYRNSNFRKETPEEYFNRLTSLPDNKSEAFYKANFLKENIKNINSILDVGCGGGIVAYRLKKAFPKAKIEGIEPNKSYAELARKKLQIKVYDEDYDIGTTKEKYDLIIMCDTLEHLLEIDKIWELFQININKNGYIFIVIPSPKNFNILIENPEHEVFNACHLYFFYKKHIEQLANKNNFGIIKTHSVKENGYKDYYLLRYRGARLPKIFER